MLTRFKQGPPFSIIDTSKPALCLQLGQVGSDVDIDLGGDDQTARVYAVQMKFPSGKWFTFDIRYRDEDSNLISTVRDYACPCSPMLSCAHIRSPV